MTTDVQPAGTGALDHSAGPGLADVLDTILDKGVVIDAYVQVSVVGIDILTINARVVVASVDTYLRFAEAVNRLDLTESKGEGISGLVGDVKEAVGGVTNGVAGGAKPALEATGETLRDVLPGTAEQRSSESGESQRRGE
ncbi:MAG TPA: gas vesicle protein GvpJ [Candidatus Limnocylindrales bacterium]|nr:gas vesicle protein GvpJ [Candidatus Limnocylindrales bacterium]